MTDKGELTIRTVADNRIQSAEVYLQELIVPVGTNGIATVEACGKCGSLQMQIVRYVIEGEAGGRFTITVHCEGQLAFEERATIPDFFPSYDSYFRFFRI